MKWIFVLAAIFVSTGLFFPFVNLGILPKEYQTTEFINALFSLAGVFLFVGALLYQAKEYRLQVEELRKSVEAQTKSAAMMEEQKLLLLEQGTNNFLFTIIDNFGRFRERKEIQLAIDKCYHHYSAILARELRRLVETAAPNIDAEMAKVIRFTLIQDKKIQDSAPFVQFAFNIFHVIDQKILLTKQQDWFTPYVYSQLSKKEVLILYLAHLGDHFGSFYGKLYWRVTISTSLIEMIYESMSTDPSSSVLNPLQLTEELNKLNPHAYSGS